MEDNLPLFGPDDDWRYNAVLNYNMDDWRIYAQGYKQAAEVIIEQMKLDTGLLDTLVFPAIFLYRQFIELSLKRLYKEAVKITGDEFQPQMNHDIKLMWDRLRPLVEKIAFTTVNPLHSLDECGEIIKRFSETDPSSDAFRYPVKKSGEKSLPHLSHVNVEVFQSYMAIVDEVLDQIIILTDYAGESYSEYLGYT